MTADVQRELAEVLCTHAHPAMQKTLMAVHDTGDERDAVLACYACQRQAEHLGPLIADAEKRAAAGALLDLAAVADAVPAGPVTADQIRTEAGRYRAAALDPAGADSGEGR